MKVEKLERIALNVPDLEEAVQVFSRLLGIHFEKKVELKQPDGKEIKAMISSQGLELVQEVPPLTEMGVRSFHFRVPDLDAAKKWVDNNGGKVISEFPVGKVRQAVCKISGLRVILINYPGDDVIQAME